MATLIKIIKFIFDAIALWRKGASETPDPRAKAEEELKRLEEKYTVQPEAVKDPNERR